MFEEQVIIIAAQQEAESTLDENGMEPFESVMEKIFWDLLILKNEAE